MAENGNILEIRDLHKNFYIKGQKLEVLSGVNLSVKDGELVAIVGASGCGKSTLLKLIITLESISSGEILLDGEPVNGPSPKCSMIFQEARLFPWLTVRQNIEFVIPDSVPKEKKKEMVEYYTNLVGLSEFMNAVPNQLSGGMQQRVSIARALATRPQLLLLDEPFGALDAFTRMNMQNEVLRIREQDKTTMIIVTHEIDEAIYLSNRVVIMGKNPGVVKRIVPVDLPFPRDRTSAEFLEIRGEIMKEFLQT
ncbi:MAG TPA: ABC transporter ATP-binding protein [Candidatus Lachnoclostridium stercorigallinarum]|uniref:ABC transporter ATP-binding protein n=1 Tax=Candidatus Lachnoclostridium stercorigallinarum TaxID=2838634 RepID=A0A9D2GG20_9FIRM|nr:ABC transporter ATP-binding protein [Candidatus Lachnoclostridium stercorigallinarum]